MHISKPCKKNTRSNQIHAIKFIKQSSIKTEASINQPRTRSRDIHYHKRSNQGRLGHECLKSGQASFGGSSWSSVTMIIIHQDYNHPTLQDASNQQGQSTTVMGSIDHLAPAPGKHTHNHNTHHTLATNLRPKQLAQYTTEITN